MILRIIVTCKFLVELEVQERIFGSYMRNRDMEDSQGSYNHEEEVRGLDVNMGNEETDSNGRRSKVEPMDMDKTMRRLKK
jgi:hypothetical protein